MALEQNERFLSAHISDLCRKSRSSGVPRFSSFLNEREAIIAAEAARAERSCPVFYGGYDGAARTVCGFFEQTFAEDFDESARNGLFPVSAVTFSFRSCDRLSHRYFLGAVLGVGLKREAVGDIVVSEGSAVVFCLDIAAELALGIDKVGRTGVVAENGVTKPIIKHEPLQIYASVSSMRLDCIVGACINASRDKSASLVKSGQVSADFSVCIEVSAAVKVNTVLSIRGYGRFRVSKIVGETHKGRLKVVIDKFV